MLTHLHIRNFAIIDSIEIELQQGMTVLTGETGAGKSILLDALGLLLGDRADSAQLREGAEKADISALFSIEDNPAALAWLAANELDDNGECLIRRTISRDTRSRGYINGQVAPLQLLRTLGEMLVDIHGQHEHQLLMRKATQRELLDAYAGNNPLLDKLAVNYRALQRIDEQLDALEESGSAAGQMDMLQYQLDELEQLDLSATHINAIEQEHKRMSNAGRLLGDCQSTLEALYEGDHALHSQLAAMQHTIGVLCGLDPALDAVSKTLGDAAINCNEAAIELRDYLARIELDDNRLAMLEQTLTTLHSLSRKHKTTPERLAETREKLASQLALLASADHNREQLAAQRVQLIDSYNSIDKALSHARHEGGAKLGEEISAHMQALGMSGGLFSVAISSTQRDKPGLYGSDDITFMVSANPGQSPKALTKVASGGELSRISLALQLVASKYKSSATLIFDEVDGGIGGAVAETVGRQLRKLSAQAQVMCVTHLPQVASQGNAHFVVSKRSDGEHTRVHIQLLDATEKVEEIARMLGGISITEQSRSHAQEMLTNAGSN